MRFRPVGHVLPANDTAYRKRPANDVNIHPSFCTGGDPYDGIVFEERTSRMTDPKTGAILAECKAVVPASWNSTATDIIAQKYFRKAGVPSEWDSVEEEGIPYWLQRRVPAEDAQLGEETDARQVFNRLAGCWAYWGVKAGYFDAESARSYYDDMCWLLARQTGAPNSPQWFNTGLHWAYGITGPAQGHFYVDYRTGELKQSEDAYSHPAPHACLPGHALVTTPDGPIPIGHIVEENLVGLPVYDKDGLTHVVATKHNGIKPVYKIETTSGNFIEATADHLVFAKRTTQNEPDWISVGDLKSGMRLMRRTDTTSSKLHGEIITQITCVGDMDVYDIETESHSFLTNGAVVHNCFINSVADDLIGDGGIFDLFTREARIFKFGAGAGSNFSNLRGANERLSGGGKSSGVMSFLRVGDRAAGAIKSGGTTRRAAKMTILNADHPDIEQFVTWKVAEEQKVADLVVGSLTAQRHYNAILAACLDKTIHESGRFRPDQNPGLRIALREAKKSGLPGGSIQQVLDLAKQGATSVTIDAYDADWNSEAYATVSGQNSNNSIRVTDDYMRAVDADADWNLIRRTDGRIQKTLKARDLWDKVARAAWQCADPGIQFDTTYNDWHTCPADGRINATNPCSEYAFLDDTGCNLASVNLSSFLQEKNKTISGFDVASFEKAVRLWTITLDISVTMSQLPAPLVARKTFDYRTLGLGYANLGTLLMRLGLPYDSDTARGLCAAITAIEHGVAYRTSAEMAAELGSFPRYEANKYGMLRVIRNHRRAAFGKDDGYESISTLPVVHQPTAETAYLWEAARAIWDETLALGEKHGYRNAQLTCTAPTGTIGLLMQCDTTGIEPDYALVKFKTLAGGGYFKIVNDSVPPALENLGYTAEQISAITTYATGTGKLSEADKTRLLDLGMTPEVLVMMEKSLPGAMTIEMAAGMAGANLAALGLSPESISAMSDRVCGTMMLEGAPFLQPEHVPVFDCATKCGLKGTRYIEPRAHIDMMAAAQPFISGSISKTINMPNEATIEDIKAAYRHAWKVGVKSVALYRDGSKLSQPLSSFYDVDSDQDSGLPSATAKALAAADAILKMGQRRKLPARCASYRQKFSIGGHDIFVHTGEYEDGTLGEIFLDMSKEGSAFRAMMNNFAIAVSMGLQYGVPLQAYVDAFTFTRFEPNGPVVGHDNLKMGTSILDVVFRDLAISYLGQFELAHVKPPQIGLDPIVADAANAAGYNNQPLKPVSAGAHLNGKNPATAAAKTLSALTIAKGQGYEGEACRACGLMTLVRNGACLKCNTCGETTGCS